MFEKVDGDELVPTKCLPLYGLPTDKIVAGLSKRTGWKIDSAEKLYFMKEPGGEQIQLLRLFDPDRYFLGKARAENKPEQ